MSKWVLTDKKINHIQVDSIDALIKRAKAAHLVDVRVRINGQYEWHQADWIKHMARKRTVFDWLGRRYWWAFKFNTRHRRRAEGKTAATTGESK